MHRYSGEIDSNMMPKRLNMLENMTVESIYRSSTKLVIPFWLY